MLSANRLSAAPNVSVFITPSLPKTALGHAPLCVRSSLFRRKPRLHLAPSSKTRARLARGFREVSAACVRHFEWVMSQGPRQDWRSRHDTRHNPYPDAHASASGQGLDSPAFVVRHRNIETPLEVNSADRPGPVITPMNFTHSYPPSMPDNQKWNYSGGELPELTPIVHGGGVGVPLREPYTPMHAMAAVTPMDMEAARTSPPQSGAWLSDKTIAVEARIIDTICSEVPSRGLRCDGDMWNGWNSEEEEEDGEEYDDIDDELDSEDEDYTPGLGTLPALGTKKRCRDGLCNESNLQCHKDEATPAVKGKNSFEARRKQQKEEIENGFRDFKCKCAQAKRDGHDSCLENFTKGELRAIHREAFPESKSSLAHLNEHIHLLYWHAAEPLDTPDANGHTYKVNRLSLGKKVVCQVAFQRGVGGARHAHREKLSLVLRGYSPSSLTVVQEAKILLKAQETRRGRHAERAAFARCWWADQLSLQDWLPNEQAIQFKGPFWDVLHKTVYVPVAKARSGKEPLKYKAWKHQMLMGAQQLCESLGDCRDVRKIRVKRSARHSKFPECTDCQRLRARYLQVMSNPGSSEAEREQALHELQVHMGQWQTDRSTALRFKDLSAASDSQTCYECDDKCGSHWVSLPVAPGGRDNKSNAKCKFDFALQCNTITGGGGSTAS